MSAPSERMHCEKHPVSIPENIPQRLFCSSHFLLVILVAGCFLQNIGVYLAYCSAPRSQYFRNRTGFRDTSAGSEGGFTIENFAHRAEQVTGRLLHPRYKKSQGRIAIRVNT